MKKVINTANQYAQAVATFDQDLERLRQSRINAMIDRIPQNVNRTGKTYRRLVTKIREEYETTNNTRH